MALPYIPFYFGDYWRDTAHLSDSEHVAYLRLISYYWYQGGLPKDDKRLAAITMRPLAEWLEMKETIQEFFGNDWVHSRIERDLKKQTEGYRAKVEGGKKGASKRWGKDNYNELPNGLANGYPNGSANRTPNSNQNHNQNHIYPFPNHEDESF
jgi:uncharacterized protein YdaU (DUF1376 family)